MTIRKPTAFCRRSIPCWLNLICLLLWVTATPATQAQTLEGAMRLQSTAEKLFKKERYREALPLAQQALVIREQLQGPEHADTGRCVGKLAVIQRNLGDYATAAASSLRALAILEKTIGPNSLDTIDVINTLGTSYMSMGDYGKAEPLLLRALEFGEKVLGTDNFDTTRFLGNLGILYTRMGQYDRAESMTVRALASAEKTVGKEHVMAAALSDSLGLLYLRQGKFADAVPLFQRHLRIRQKLSGPNSWGTAQALDHLGVVYDNTGEFRKAERLLLRALAIREKVLGPTDEYTGVSAEHLGGVYLHMGKLAKAVPLLQRAVRINQQRLGPEHPDTAKSLSNLAAIYYDMGLYPKAEELNQRALQIRRKVFGEDNPEVAFSLHNLGTVSAATGAYAQAESLYKRALAICEKSLGAAHPYTATSLAELAQLYRTTGELDKARNLLERALEARETTLGAEHPYTLETRSVLGLLYLDLGLREQSEPLLSSAFEVQQRLLPTDSPNLIATMSNLAKLYFATSRSTQGIDLQGRACNLLHKALGLENPSTVSCLNDLAMMHWDMGAAALATPLLAQAQTAQARNSLRLLLSGSEARKRAYLQTVATDLASHVSFSVAVKSGAAITLGATDALQYKGLLQEAMSNGVTRLRQGTAARDRQLLDDLAAVANQFSNLIYQTKADASPDAYSQRSAVLEREQQRLETELAKRSSTVRSQLVPVTLAQIRAVLPSDALLIEWLRYQPRIAGPTMFDTRRNDPAPRYVAYLISRHEEPAVVDLGDAQSIDVLVAELRSAAGDPARSDYRDAAAALAQRIYLPLQARARNYRHLLVSPDGALNLVPMGVLIDEQGKYLLERFEITHLSSGRDLLALASAERSANEPVVVAAPSYGELGGDLRAPNAFAQRSADMDRSGLRFRALPGAIREGRDISRLLGISPQNLLLQNAATEAALKQLHSPRILHIATHGFFLSDQDVRGQLQRGAASGVTALPENPLLRSGLALAGANLRRSGNRDDGILTALELAQLDLHGTQLVVLSACESGVGTIQNGEGVNGLRRALALAGAQSQLTSLWKVADLPTQELMINYYSRLLRGVGRAAALREAQLAAKAGAGHAHPYYWGAFTSIGDWRPLQGLTKKQNATATSNAVPAAN